MCWPTVRSMAAPTACRVRDTPDTSPRGRLRASVTRRRQTARQGDVDALAGVRRASRGSRPAVDQESTRNAVRQRLERWRMRVVSSVTWSKTSRRSAISLRIFFSAYITVV